MLAFCAVGVLGKFSEKGLIDFAERKNARHIFIALARKWNEPAANILLAHAARRARRVKARLVVRDAPRIGCARALRRTPNDSLLSAVILRLVGANDFAQLLASAPWTVRAQISPRARVIVLAPSNETSDCAGAGLLARGNPRHRRRPRAGDGQGRRKRGRAGDESVSWQAVSISKDALL